MSEYESIENGSSDIPASGPGHFPAASGNSGHAAYSHYLSDPAQIVSRMPDLGPDESEMRSDRTRNRRRRSRPKKSTLSTKTWTWIGMGSVVIVLIAFAVFWGGKSSSDSASDERAAWEPESPAPDAPMAPTWGAAAGEGSGWQNAGGAPPYQPTDGYANQPGYNTPDSGAQPPSWNDPSQVSSSPSWGGQPEAVWGGATQTPADTTQSPWGRATNPTYSDQQGYAQQQPAWESQPDQSAAPASSWPAAPYASAGEQFRTETSPWANDPRSAPMAASSPRTAMMGQAGGYAPTSPPAGSTLPSVGSYRAAAAAPAYSNSYQESYQAPYQQPSIEAGRPPAAGSFDSNDYREPPAYRPQAASTVYPTDAASSVARRNGYQTAYPQSTSYATGSQPSNSYGYGSNPATDVSSAYGNTYPAAPSSSGTYPADTYPSNAYPSNAYPANTNPANAYPSNAYPANTNPANAYPANAYPANTNPANAYPANAYPANTNPSNAYPANTYPANAYPSSRDSSSYPSTVYPSTNSSYPATAYNTAGRPDSGVSTQYPQTGTARLNGVIEMASPRSAYDRGRSSLY
jgi:hypothetical protein